MFQFWLGLRLGLSLGVRLKFRISFRVRVRVRVIVSIRVSVRVSVRVLFRSGEELASSLHKALFSSHVPKPREAVGPARGCLAGAGRGGGEARRASRAEEPAPGRGSVVGTDPSFSSSPLAGTPVEPGTNFRGVKTWWFCRLPAGWAAPLLLLRQTRVGETGSLFKSAPHTARFPASQRAAVAELFYYV